MEIKKSNKKYVFLTENPVFNIMFMQRHFRYFFIKSSLLCNSFVF